jgi:hypothetical protein
MNQLRSAGLTGLLILLAALAAWLGWTSWLATALAGALGGIWANHTPRMGWSTGFSAGFTTWWGAAMLSNVPNGGMLAGKVGQVLQGLEGWHLLTLTGLIGGLLGGLGVLTGVYGKALLARR